MPARFKRTAVSLVAVLAAFWVYRLVAVPLIEPALEDRRVPTATSAEREAARMRQHQNRLGSYLRFFPAGSWEHDNPIVLESGNAKLLLKKYENLPDGRLKLTPCTVIYLPEGDAEETENRRRVVILQAPQGAELQFDKPMDLSKDEIGRLVGGVMPGPITIHSGPTRPEGGDDLLITTHDVQLIDQRIVTPHEVDFRFGASYGHGRELRIQMLPAPATSAKTRGLGMGSVQSIELVREVEMHLQGGSAGFVPGDRSGNDASANDANSGGTRGRRPQPPVDIRCQGPLQFDMVKYIATFHDNVRAVRPNPTGNGPSDQLTCDLLSVLFAPREAQPSGAPRPGTPRLEPRRIVADGNVVLRAPSTQREGQAQRMEYDLPGRGAWLSPMQSTGPGWLSVANPDDISHRFEVRWSRELKMRPDGENFVVSIVGDARANYTGQGEIAADAIHVWLFEIPPAQRAQGQDRGARRDGGADNWRSRIRPVKMMAEGKVQIESVQLSGKTNRLEASFREALANSDSANERGASQNRSPTLRRRSANDQARQHYEIRQADLLQAWFVMGPPDAADQRPIVEHLSLQGNVWFAESAAAEPSEKPLEIRGDQLELLNANGASAKAKVVGQPAQVAARGMTMLGETVQVDRAANRVWIDGAGRMTVTSDVAPPRGERSPPAAAAPQTTSDGNLFGDSLEGGTTIVDFQGGMAFDGKIARFERDVTANQVAGPRTQTLRTQVLEAVLRERIDFGAANSQLRPYVELLRCRGEVWLENRETHKGNLASIDRMLHVYDLAIDRTTGDLSGVVQGKEPGRLLSWRLGDSLFPTGRDAARRPATPGQVAREEINYLEVQFQRGVTGNLRDELRFDDRVRSVYGPVADWNAQLEVDNPKGLLPGCSSISCDQLSVSQIGPQVNGRRLMDLLAMGNTRIDVCRPDGDAFTILADKLTFSQAKDMLTLYGEGNNFAKLYSRPRTSGPQPPMIAKTIQFRPSTRDFKFQGVQSVGATRFGAAAAMAPRP